MAKEFKQYQPDRKDLLINTDWGIPQDSISEEQAKEQNLRLYFGRYVTEQEHTLLWEQRPAYRGIRVIAVLWFLVGLLLIPSTVACSETLLWGLLNFGYNAAVLLSAVGLWRFWKPCWYVALVLSLLMLVRSMFAFGLAVAKHGFAAAAGPASVVLVFMLLVAWCILGGMVAILFRKWVLRIFRITRNNGSDQQKATHTPAAS